MPAANQYPRRSGPAQTKESEMQITIDCDLDAAQISKIISTLQDLVWQERDHDESMQSGHGHGLTVAIDCLENIRQGIFRQRIIDLPR
jgi:hypothetical protein